MDPARHSAAHVTADSQEFIDLCAEALARDGLHHVAAYHRGVYNYSVDVLDGLGTDGLLPGGLSTGSSRELYIRVGRQLNFLLGRMDRALRPVESGRLIRTVLRLGEASVFHYYVRPGEYLTGVSLGQGNDESGDRAMARLATQFALTLRQRGLNYGGFEEEGPKDPLRRSDLAVASGPTTEEEALHTDRSGILGPDQDEIRALCVAALSAEDLHYAAYFDPAAGFLSADVLELAVLAPYFRNISRQERRDRYQDIARRLPFVVARLNHSLQAVLPGRLTRTVFDVDEGALYYFAAGSGPFLLGVTLHQDRVFHADIRMNMLNNSVERVIKEGKSSGH
ncbi:hypothetical protein [Streptomyces sp. NBC_00986]|uniref:hypothetical protein n=1 Tax=Streptomyces sp. NBC_00986 TaxID=2903702 RepID=UPI00386C6260|nr:hypothetical protein OG504_13395 [Streptomyces sp. NBC_00986]